MNKIISDISQATNNLAPNQPDTSAKNPKIPPKVAVSTAAELNPGDRFRATIMNVTPNGLTLKLEGGAIIAAKSLVSPDAHIGDTVVFLVTESFKGQVLLEMIKNGGQGPGLAGEGSGPISGGVVREALLAADMPLTDQNIQLVLSLADSGLPIDARTLQTAAFFMYKDPAIKLTFDQIKFLLNEGMPPNETTLRAFAEMLNRSAGIGQKFGELIRVLTELPDAALRHEVLAFLAGDRLSEALESLEAMRHNDSTALEQEGVVVEGAETTEELVSLIEKGETEPKAVDEANKDSANKTAEGRHNHTQDRLTHVLAEAVKNRFYTDIVKDGLKDIGKTFKELNKAMTELATQFRDRGLDERAVKTAEDIRNNLLFMNNIKNNKEYMQIPFQAQLRENEAELHVFKKRKKRLATAQTALIALDYGHLKHVETFITRNGANVTLQFKAENSRILNILGSGIYRLSDAMAAAGFKLSGVTFRKLKEPSDITAESAEDGNQDDKGISKYSVDVRV